MANARQAVEVVQRENAHSTLPVLFPGSASPLRFPSDPQVVGVWPASYLPPSRNRACANGSLLWLGSAPGRFGNRTRWQTMSNRNNRNNAPLIILAFTGDFSIGCVINNDRFPIGQNHLHVGPLFHSRELAIKSYLITKTSGQCGIPTCGGHVMLNPALDSVPIRSVER